MFIPRRVAVRIFGLAVGLSIVAILAMDQIPRIPLLITFQRISPSRRISTIDIYNEPITVDDGVISNMSATKPITPTIYSSTRQHGHPVPAKSNNNELSSSTNNKNNTIGRYDQKVFLMDAYLIDDQLIRITTIRKCKSKQRLKLFLRFNVTTFAIPTNSQPIQSCPWHWARKCNFVGYFTYVNLPKTIMPRISNESMPDVAISSSDDKRDTRLPIRLHDVRITQPSRQHQLAVCLQPIFLLADWTILVQFFETWIVQGASKFYIYAHSMAPEVDALLKVYEADHEIDVERVAWAPLPVLNATSPQDDPNYFIYRTEVVTAVNDCVLRSRGQTKYVVSSDLDEIIVPFHHNQLMPLIRKLQLAAPKAGAFVFLHSYAMFENNWSEAPGPQAITFDKFAEIELEDYIWPSGERSKVIMVPEMIRTAHVHTVLHMEKGAKMVTVPPKEGLVFHLRRVAKRENVTVNGTKTSTDLARFIEPCNKLWKERQARIADVPGTEILRNKLWPNRGLKVMRELEECLVKDFAHRAETCNSPFKCIDAIEAVPRGDWVWARQTWTML